MIILICNGDSPGAGNLFGRRHQVDYRRGYISADICLGKLTLRQALDQLRTPPWADLDVDADLAFVARKLDYTPDQLNAAMQAPAALVFRFPPSSALSGLRLQHVPLPDRAREGVELLI